MVGENKLCGICQANPQLQGGLVYEEGKDLLRVVCGLHLTEKGTALKKGELAGKWKVFTTWGYEGAESPQFAGPASHALAMFDEILERIKGRSDPNWGWKTVVGVGPVTLEASTFPKERGYSKPSPKPAGKPEPGAPVQLNNEAINDALPWKHKKDGETYDAELATPWSYTFVQDRDGTQSPLQVELEAAIEAADKGKLVIGDYTYTLAGTDGNLFNRNKKGGKKK